MIYRYKKGKNATRQYSLFYRSRRWIGLFLLALFTTLGCILFSPIRVTAQNVITAKTDSLDIGQTQSSEKIIQQARQAYQTGKYDEAVGLLEEALAIIPEDSLAKAAILSNLALAYQKLGEWDKVGDLIAQSEEILQQFPDNRERQLILAPTLDLKGKLQLIQGKAELALTTWQKVTSIYESLGNTQGVIRSKINQAQALQSLGFYRRAGKLLTELDRTLQEQPDSLTKAVGLRSLGNSLQSVGELEQARQALESSLEVAQNLGSAEDISAVLFSLGNVAYSQQEYTQAIDYYQQVVNNSPSLEQQIKALLNYLNLLIETETSPDIPPLLSEIETRLDRAKLNRPTVYARINYAQSLTKLRYQSNTIQTLIKPQKIQSILTTALTQARELNDKPTEAYALGNLGRLYELEKQWQPAQKLTQQALAISQAANAQDIAYQWQWQLGRLLKVQHQAREATIAYKQAVNTLQSLRSDLVSVNPEIRFSFRESVEPIYREYVDLLLQTKDNSEPNVEDLTAAREAIDSLQLAELENFFRATCLDAQPVLLDQITDQDDPNAAIVYPIVLPDRFEIILKLPQQQLQHYTVPIDNSQRRDRILQRLTQTLPRVNSRETLPLAKQIYDWLIRPLEQDLASSQVKTLVFVLDSSLRNIPMSILHDGQQYLIEKYAVALAPGLQLVQPQPIAQKQLKALTAGLTEARGGFPALEYVANELDTIKSEVAETDILLNKEFTSSSLQSKIAELPFPVVHLATHGQFSSQAENTFILTWDDRLNINQLRNLLQQRGGEQEIELLVLSACETLSGDKRAALGLAGVAVRAGARSTLGSLWQVNDEATSLLMSNFYQKLAQANSTKVEALRQAQLSLLNNPRFDSPFYWSSFVLLGNWL
ncbi:MAG: CHAT domain-containing protein [Xenococcaceae cyanobacterium]